MKLPRDVSGGELVRLLGRLGYRVARQTGSHIRLTSLPHRFQPQPTARGTLAAILTDIVAHHRLDRDELLRKLFG